MVIYRNIDTYNIYDIINLDVKTLNEILKVLIPNPIVKKIPGNKNLF